MTAIPEVPERPTDLLLINYDGFCLGHKEDFADTFLDFEEFDEAVAVAKWWQAWIDGVDL
jgi:hypothetical protein